MGLFNLVAKMSLNDRGFQAGIKRVESQSNKFARSFRSSVGGAISGVFAGAAITNATRNTIKYASTITDLQAKTGIAGKTLQAFDVAGRQAGLSLEDVAKSVRNLARAQSDFKAGLGSGLDESFKLLGVSIDDLNNKKADELLLQIGKAAASMDNSLDLQNAISDVFGRQGQQILQAFNKDFANLVETQDESLLMSDEQLNKLTLLGDKMAELGFKIQQALGGALSFVIDRVNDLSDGLAIMFGNVAIFGESLLKGRGLDKSLDDVAEFTNTVLENRQKREAELKRSLSTGATNIIPSPDDLTEPGSSRASLSGQRVQADSLRRIGGFAAIGSKSENRDRLVKMNQLLEKISKSTKQTADNTKEDAI